jgi:hypothetical protein
MRNKKKKIIKSTIFLFLIVSVLSISTYKHILKLREVHKVMDNLTLHYNNRDHFLPVISAVISDKEIEQIFAIPFKNCVGTYYADDGITALECSGNIANKKMVFPLYDSYPYSPGQIFCTLPVNKDEIMWGHNLVLSIVNFHVHSDLGFGNGLSEYVADIKIIDSGNYKVLLKFEISSLKYSYRLIKLHPLDYSKKSAWGNYDMIEEISCEDDLQNELNNCYHNGYFFFYSEKNHRLQVYDKNLKKTTHPMVDAVEGYPFSIVSLKVHPTLPFAITDGRDKNSEDQFFVQHYSIVRWELEDKKERFVPLPLEQILQHTLPDSSLYCSNLQFSPDGNWLILHDGTVDDTNPEIVVFPIKKDNPMYLGKPVFLGKVMREGAKLLSWAWIEEPMKYVICDGKLLYSWELEVIKDRLEHKQ